MWQGRRVSKPWASRMLGLARTLLFQGELSLIVYIWREWNAMVEQLGQLKVELGCSSARPDVREKDI